MAEDGFFERYFVVDMSEQPLERVAAAQPWAWLSLPPLELRHPDLWHDGRWLEK